MTLAAETGFHFSTVMLHWIKWLEVTWTPRLEGLVSHKVKSTKSLPMTAWLGFFKGVSYKIGNNSALPAFLCIVPFVLRNP